MRASLKTYQAVAAECSEYRRSAEPYSPANTMAESDVPSCANCTHFTVKEYCDIDLYDQIVKRINVRAQA